MLLTALWRTVVLNPDVRLQ